MTDEQRVRIDAIVETERRLWSDEEWSKMSEAIRSYHERTARYWAERLVVTGSL